MEQYICVLCLEDMFEHYLLLFITLTWKVKCLKSLVFYATVQRLSQNAIDSNVIDLLFIIKSSYLCT
jgi:hypothetical protein